MRCLVIGGTLFIGRALVRRLLARGDGVTILHRGKKNPFAGQTEEIHCDRNDAEAVRKALRVKQFDVVFDNVYDWQRGTTAEQVEAAALASAEGLQRYVFTSSVAAYGDGLNHSEDDPLAPPDHPFPYMRDKAETERMLFRLHRDRGFPAVTLRPPFIYGPENPFYREAFFWDRLLADRPIIVPDDGERLMQFVFVEDVARAAILAVEKEAAVGRAYNVANPRPITQKEFVEALAQAAGKPAKMVFVPQEKLEAAGGNVFEPPLFFGQYLHLPPITQNTARAKRDLGFEATPLEKGLVETFAWYRTQDRGKPDFSFDDKVLAAGL
jgi:nucleoside-diphosphate-sugar epimerase